VRRIDGVALPLGLVAAVVLSAEGISAWWLGLVPATFGLLGLLTIGPAIRRAELHGPNDPTTRPARVRRAERVTITMFAVFTAVAVGVSLLAEGPGLAVTMGVLLSAGGLLGMVWEELAFTNITPQEKD
jgi:hypothetical protein